MDFETALVIANVRKELEQVHVAVNRLAVAQEEANRLKALELGKPLPKAVKKEGKQYE